jgi:hypothetical protein
MQRLESHAAQQLKVGSRLSIILEFDYSVA